MNKQFFPTQSIYSCLQLIWEMQPRKITFVATAVFLLLHLTFILNECVAINEEKQEIESTYFLQT